MALQLFALLLSSESVWTLLIIWTSLMITPAYTAFWRGSRYIRDRCFLSEDQADVVSTLVKSGEKRGGLLVPTNDPYLILVSQHHAALSRVFTVTVPPWEILGP